MGITSLVAKLAKGLSKTREVFTNKIRDIFSEFKKLDNEQIDKLEEVLISSDCGVETTANIIDSLRQAYKEGRISSTDGVIEYLKIGLKAILKGDLLDINYALNPPTVILVAGVNGTGKTTSIGKLAWLFKQEGKKVILSASDTFRTAAIEQLSIWSQRIGVDIVKHKLGADPAAVTYDAVESAVARSYDILIVDTAGRLQTKVNLMKELTKIRNVISKKIDKAPHEVLLVLDATTGQNAISQAIHFKEAIDITGLFLAKLDGTAKGGIVIAIKTKLGIPVKFVGIGERPEDIERFNPDRFIEALFE
jgi:fused signal recognition particle receptor